MEDYCFSFEHTVEFQVVFLQHVLGPDVKILPVLCGPFARSLYQAGNPEDDDGVRRFFDSLSELHDREGDRLIWVLGVDMAHMGARYGDRFQAIANEGRMAEVSLRDERRMERINAGARAPTKDEFRGEVWSAIMHGANGIIYFPQVVPTSGVGGSFSS